MTFITVFKRYNVVTEDELRGLVVPPIGTYTGTNEKEDSTDNS